MSKKIQRFISLTFAFILIFTGFTEPLIVIGNAVSEGVKEYLPDEFERPPGIAITEVDANRKAKLGKSYKLKLTQTH